VPVTLPGHGACFSFGGLVWNVYGGVSL